MGLAVILFVGGVVIFAWLFFWSRQRQNLGSQPALEQVLQDIPAASTDDAILVSREHGQLIYVNDRARHWLGMNGGQPNLEYVARQAQPTDSFLELFSNERQISFQLGQRWVEASSHRIPAGSETRTVVVMRQLGATTTNPDALDLSQAIGIINRIGELVDASQSVEQVLQLVLEIVTENVNADAGEICLWNEADEALYPRGWMGDVAYVLRLSEVGGMYRPGEGITGWIALHHKPVLSSSADDTDSIRPKLPDSAYKSFVGVPLMLGERFLGTFELASTGVDAFSQRDLALLQAISQQIAISIHNAELYARQSRHIENMASLQTAMQQDSADDYVQAVYSALHERLARLIGADMCGILLYDPQRQALVPQLPFYGIPDQVTRQYSIPLPGSSPQYVIWQKHDYWISNDVSDEPLVEQLQLQPLIMATGVYNTALIPLEIGHERIGAIQVSNKAADGGFTLRDIQDLRILATQAAIVVENTRLYQREHLRETEMLGLQEITNAIGMFSDEAALFAEVNRRIADLMNIEICGILVYDPAHNRLAARPPFFGVDNELVADYSISLEPGSSMEAIWREGESWYTNQVSTDRVMVESGLESLAATLGIHQAVIVPLSIGGRRLGVVQGANRLDGELFTDNNVRLLTIFATQAAAIIENARLYRDLENRIKEAESLRRIAELAGAILTTDEPLTPLLAEIGQVVDSPIVFVNVLDANNEHLVTYPRHIYGIELHEPVVIESRPSDESSQAVMSRRPYLSNAVADDDRVAYRAMIDALGVERVLIVPLVVGERSLGELGIANREGRPYDSDDTAALSSIAVQIAGTLDRVTQYQSAGRNLNRRVLELDAISRVSNELILTLDFDQILRVIQDEAIKATGASDGTIALLKPSDEWTDKSQPEMSRRIGGEYEVLADIEREAVLQGIDCFLVTNYADTSLQPVPEAVGSAVAAAFGYENEIVGVIHLYHPQPYYFDERVTEFLRTLATKAALGYGNAIRYEDQVNRSNQLRRRVEQLNQIFELGQLLQSTTDPVTMLEAIAYSVQQSAGFDVVLMLLWDDDANGLRRVTQAGLPLDVFNATKGQLLSRETLDALQNEQYQVSESYFLPVERRDKWHSAGDLEALSTAFDGQRILDGATETDWQTGDLFLVPLRSSNNALIGMMVLDGPHNNRRPARMTVEILEIFAHQAAATIENTRLYLDSLTNAEQTTRLNQVLEAIASNLDVESILLAVAEGVQQIVPFMRMTAAVMHGERQVFDMMHISVNVDNSLSIEHDTWQSLEQTAMGRSYEERQDYFYHAGDSAIDKYHDLRELYAGSERTSLVMPLTVGGERLGAVHLGSDLQQAFGFNEFHSLIRRMINLAAVAIQNTHLLEDAVTLRQFNESVVQSIQQGIVVLDRSGRIITINAYMRSHYGWDDTAVGRDLFEYRPEMSKVLLDNVRHTLENGEQQEHINITVMIDEQPMVCNFYIYPLGTADTVRGAVLLLEDLTERAQLEQDVETRANQLAALTEVSSRITASLDHSEVVALALSAMDRIIEYDTLTFWLRHDEHLRLQGAKDYEDDTMPVGVRVKFSSHQRLNQVVENKRVYSISRLQGWDALPGEHGAQSWMGVPLVNQGNVVGVIALCKAEPNFYDAQAEQAAFAFANQVAVALANADLFREAERRTQRLSLLNRVSVALGQSLDSEDILEIALREIAQVLHIDQGYGLMFERDLQIGRVVVEHPRGDRPPDTIIDLDASATYHHIRRTVTSLIIEDVTEAGEDVMDVVRELTPRSITGYVLIPMAIGGQVIGAFELCVYDGPVDLDPEQTDLGRIIANQAAIAIQNTSLLEQTLVRSRELETLLEAAQATSMTLDVGEVYRSVVDLMLHALDMDDCALMTWDDIDRVVEVQVDVNRNNNPERITPPGTRFNLSDYPSKQRALTGREVVVLTRDTVEVGTKEYDELASFEDMAQILVPLLVRDQTVGLIQLELESEYRAFTHREIRLALALGSQAATAIENARLSTETANRVEELYIINDLSQAISATIDLDEMIKVVRRRVPAATGVEELYLALYDAEEEEITFPLYVRQDGDYEMPPRPLNNDEVSYVLRNRRPLSMGSDYFGPDELRASLGIANGEGDVKSYLGVPLISGDVVLGVLAVRDSKRTRAFGVNTQGILTTIASQLGAAIQNAHLFEQINAVNNELSELNKNLEQAVAVRTEELSQERDRINTLYRITAELARTLDLERVLRSALEMVARAVNADDGVILQVNPTNDQLFSRAALAPEAQELEDIREYVHPATLLAETLILEPSERTVVVDDLSQIEHWNAQAPGVEGMQSALAVLLEINDDVLGVMILISKQHGVFTEAHVRLALAAANQVAAAINNSDLYYLIRDQAERLGMLVLAEQAESGKSNAILEGIADGVMLADASGEIVRVNSAAERILELSQKSVLGQHLSRLIGIQGASASVWMQAITRWSESPDEDPDEGFLSEQLEYGDKVVNVRLSPVRTESQFLGVVLVFRDITKEVEVDRIKSEFISNVSHELRTPMTSIKGYADLLLMGAAGAVSEQQQHFLSTIKQNADRLSVLVNDLLNISKLDSGEEALDISDVDIKKLLETVLANLQGRAEHERKAIRVVLDIADGLPVIKGDPNKITQVFTNIVDNAFNYTYANGTIDIKASVYEDNHVLVSVKDSGIGIPEKFRDRIWERFGRFEEHALVMDVAGTGLGLPIVKTLVEMHRGEVWFESEEGKGTTFFVRLPVDQPVPDQA